MSFNRLLQPKINPFGVFIYSPKEGTFDLKTYSDKIITDAELNKYKEEGTYCNSFKDLYISEGKEFWIINNTSFSIKKKKTPIEKKNHSMIFLSSLSDSSKVFLVGGNDKKVFYFDLKKNYFMNWAQTNELHIKPALIKIDDYLYILDGVKQSTICFERTKLSGNSKSWEKICPSIEQNLILNFPKKNFATAADLNGKIVFLGGDTVTLENNNSYIYDVKNNKIDLSSKGTNDNMNFTDKNFYKINNKYSIALPDRLNEAKEIALMDKEEQSLIKLNIELPGNDDDNFIYFKYSENTYKPKKSNIINNINTQNPYSQYSYPQRKKRNIEDYTNVQKNYGKATVIIKEEPKEFGYYLSSNSSEEAKSKARRDGIEIVGITEKYDPMKNKQKYQEKNICNEEQKGNYKIEIVENVDELINLKDNNQKNKKHPHQNVEEQYTYQMQYQQDKMKYARDQGQFQKRENLCQECQQEELKKKEGLNLCQECQQEEQQNRKGKGQNIQDKEPKNEIINSEDAQYQYSSEKENKEGSAKEIQINQNQNTVQNLNIEHGKEYNKNDNENVEQIEHHEIEQEQEQNQQNNNEEIKENENLEINQQLNVEEEKKENIPQEEVHNEQQINIEEHNKENIENVQKEEINNENEQNNQINEEEINQEENIEQNVQHELDFNNAQMQNENNNENEEDHFTEPGLNNSQEEMNQENEDNIKIQQNVAVENGEDLKYKENEEEQQNEENGEEQHIENDEEQQYIDNVEDQQIENEEEQHIESGEEQYIENGEEQHIENGEEQENIENGEEEHIENGEEPEMNINNEQEGQIEDQNQENSIHQEGNDNQIVGQENDGEEQEQEFDAEGEAYEGEGEEGYEEGEEMHQNDGEEVHQVHHENEEVEYDGEGQAQGMEEEIEREPEEGEVEEQIQERDSLKKTMTQNIGDEVIEISEYPNNIYYDKENFCDYKP